MNSTALPASPPAAAARRTLILLSLFAVYVIWGSTYFAIRVAIQTFPPFLMGGIRFLLAGGGMYLVLRLRGAPTPTAREWRGAAIIGTLFLFVANGSVAFAEQWVSSSLTALIIASTPFWIVLFEGLQGQWPRRMEWLGLAVGFAGVGLLNFEGQLRASPLGAALLVLATVAWANGAVWSRRLALPKGAMASAVEMLAGGVLQLSMGLLLRERIPPGPWPWQPIAAWLFLVIFGSIVAFSAFGYLLNNVRPSVFSSYAFVNPAVAVALGVGLAGETLSPVTYLAMAIILLGVIVITYRKR